MRKFIGFILVILLVGSGLWAWNSWKNAVVQSTEYPDQTDVSSGDPNTARPQDNLAADLTRTNDSNNVTAAVSPVNLGEEDSDKNLVFQISLNTHSVSLSGYDIAASTVVRSSTGEVTTGFNWEPQSEAEHHRSGLLTVPNDGVLKDNTKWLTFELKNLAGVPVREFRWEEQDLQ